MIHRPANSTMCRFFALFALAFLLLAPAALAAVTEQDLATLNLQTTATPGAARTGAPQALSLPWMLGRMALSLGVVFGLMWAVLWAARRYMPQAGKGGRGGPIELLGSRQLGQRRSLLLVRVQGKMLLLGATPQNIQTLAELEPDSEGATWQDAALAAGLNSEFGIRNAE